MSHANLLLLLVGLSGAVALWKLSTGPGFRFSPALLFYVLFFMMQVMGFMALADESDHLDHLARFGIGLGIFGLVSGVATVSAWSRFRGSELSELRDRYTFAEPHVQNKVIIMTVGYLVSCAILVYFYQGGGGVPLLQSISALASGDEFVAAQVLLKERRMEITYFEESSYRGQGYADQFRTIILPYIVACFIVWRSMSKRRTLRIVALVSILPVLLFLAGTGQRHPILSFILMASVVSYVVTPRHNHKRILLSFAIVGFVVFAVLTFMLGRYAHTGKFSSDVPMVFVGLRDRILYANSSSTMSLFHLFPNPEPFRWGWTWLDDLKGFLPGPHIGFSSWLYRRLHGQVGTASPMCFGVMYANFGLPGIFFGAAGMGMLLQLTQVIWARRRSYRVEHVVLYCMLSMSFAWWSVGGVLAPIQHGIIALPMLFVLTHLGQYAVTILSFQGSMWRRPMIPTLRGSRARTPDAAV